MACAWFQGYPSATERSKLTNTICAVFDIARNGKRGDFLRKQRAISRGMFRCNLSVRTYGGRPKPHRIFGRSGVASASAFTGEEPLAESHSIYSSWKQPAFCQTLKSILPQPWVKGARAGNRPVIEGCTLRSKNLIPFSLEISR